MSARAMRVVSTALLIALLLLPPCAAQDFTISATADPELVEKGSELTLTVNVTNRGASSYQTIVVVTFVYPDGGSPTAGIQLQPERKIDNLGHDQTASVNYTYKARSLGSFSLTVKLYKNTTESANYLDEKVLPHVFRVSSPPGDGGAGFPIEGAAAAVAVAAVAGALAFLAMRKRPVKEPEEPEARATERPAPPTKVRGKVPKDYYKFRREKYSRLKPIGLTRSGVTILGNVKRKAPEEELDNPVEQVPAPSACCSRCGVSMDPAWKICRSCEAKECIDEAMVQLGKLARAGRNGSSLEGLLHSAQSELEAGNYDDARTYALDVLDRVNEQLKGLEESESRERVAPPEAESLPPQPAGAPGEESGERGAPPGGEGTEGAPEEVEGVPEALGPPKKVPNPCVRCGEGLRAEWKKCPYCGAVQDGVCASCGRAVKLRWGTCPHCSADLTKTRPRVECPSCGAELPDGGDCKSCRARFLLESASRLVKEVKGKGADVTEAEACLGRGELAIRLKSYEKAISQLQRAEKLAESARREFWRARVGERIAAAEAALSAALERGAAPEEARELVKKSRAALDDGRFKEAMSYAELAARGAEEAPSRAERASAERKGPHVVPVKPVVVGATCPSCGASIKPGESKCPACGSTV